MLTNMFIIQPSRGKSIKSTRFWNIPTGGVKFGDKSQLMYCICIPYFPRQFYQWKITIDKSVMIRSNRQKICDQAFGVI